jgi:hypothetical protein
MSIDPLWTKPAPHYTKKCLLCKKGTMKRDESKDKFGEEVVYMAYECNKCGHIDYTAFD